MEPGKTYVTKFPGRSRPSFVRRKVQPPNLRSGFSAGIQSLVVRQAPPRSRSVEAAPREIRVVFAPVPPAYTFAPPHLQQPLDHAGVQGGVAPQQTVQWMHVAPPQAPPPVVFQQPQPSPMVAANVERHHGRRHELILRHSCAACGKFRSPSYHHRNPLAPDEVPQPSICRRCAKVQTSSDESTDESMPSRSRSPESRKHKRSRREKKRGMRYRRSSSEDKPSIVEEVIQVTRRAEPVASPERRPSQSQSRRHSPSSPEGRPEGQAQIRVSYRPAREEKIAPPVERVHAVEHVRYIEPEEQGPSRSESRAGEHHEEDDEYVQVQRPTQQRRPIKYISYRQDDDGHIIEERRSEPTRVFSPRRPAPHLIEHEEAHRPGRLEYRHRPGRTSYVHIREPSRSSRDSFEQGYHADMPSRPPSRSDRVLRVHDRRSKNVIQDSWEDDVDEVGPPRDMFVPAEHRRRHSRGERHISEEMPPVRRRRRLRASDFDDFTLHRRSELSYVTGKSTRNI